MEYLKNNAILLCDKGTIPSLLTVTSNFKIKNRDGVFATHKDNLGAINIKPFGICAIARTCQLAGVLSGSPLTWVNTVPKVTVMGFKPLTDKSKLICPIGGIINCLTSGQM